MLRPLLISVCLTSTALATTWTVDDDGKADFNNIQAAVDAASDGDEIIVYPGTYTSTNNEVINTLGKQLWIHSIVKGHRGMSILDRNDLNLTGELIYASAQPIDIAGVPLIVDYGDTDGDSFGDLIMISDSSAGFRGGGDKYDLNISRHLCSCVEDLDCNGEVNVLDLLDIIAAWGATGDTPEDLNGDGSVDVLDLLDIIDAWGPCE